jgi:hypothetical protein
MAFYSTGVSRGDAALAAKFLADYPGASASLRSRYSHIRITTNETRWKGGRLLWIAHCEYLRDSDLIRKVSTITKSNVAASPVGLKLASGGSADQYFSVAKRPDQSSFVFRAFGPKQPDDFIADAATECIPLFATSYGDAVNISQYVTLPNVKIVSAEPVILDGNSVIEIQTSAVASESVQHVRLYFLPGSWAFAGWSWPLALTSKRPVGSVPSMELRVRYAQQDPLHLESITKWFNRPLQNPPEQMDIAISVESIEFKDIPKNKFTLAALGVQSPGSIRTRSNVWWFIIWSAVACAVLGLILGVLAQRRKMNPPRS